MIGFGKVGVNATTMNNAVISLITADTDINV